MCFRIPGEKTADLGQQFEVRVCQKPFKLNLVSIATIASYFSTPSAYTNNAVACHFYPVVSYDFYTSVIFKRKRNQMSFNRLFCNILEVFLRLSKARQLTVGLDVYSIALPITHYASTTNQFPIMMPVRP